MSFDWLASGIEISHGPPVRLVILHSGVFQKSKATPLYSTYTEFYFCYALFCVILLKYIARRVPNEVSGSVSRYVMQFDDEIHSNSTFASWAVFWRN